MFEMKLQSGTEPAFYVHFFVCMFYVIEGKEMQCN